MNIYKQGDTGYMADEQIIYLSPEEELTNVRELGKEVLVISSDRQIRAVAKAVGFRIADSLESPSSNRPRPASRPGRMAPGGKTTRPRSAPPAKGTVENRTSPQRQKPAQRALDEQLAQQPPGEAQIFLRLHLARTTTIARATSPHLLQHPQGVQIHLAQVR